ncbi:hypothetical protein [uncultured Clostridium sp.]|uniref:hypothetical protein n=1 Tax=uncultured Clostridium sp. TaxID=59620 RepID=UPI0026F3A916|nr:hypothetical protein [uncultured Clostridium sp.]
MRYTEKEYDFIFDSVYDFVRVLFSTTFLAPFRFFNEMSKKIILLGKKGIKDILNTAVIISALLLAGEFGYQILFTKLSLLKGSVPLISIAIALVGVFFLNKKVDDFDIEELDIFEECEAEEKVENILNMEKPLEDIVEKPIIENEEITTKEKSSDIMDRYDNIMNDDIIDDDTDLIAMLNNIDVSEINNSEKILDTIKNPVNEDGLSQAYSYNTQQLSGDNYDEDLAKYAEYDGIISEDINNSLKEQVEKFDVSDAYNSIPDFFDDDYDD